MSIKTRSFFSFKLSQRGVGEAVDFVIFVASAKDVAKWAGIRRVGQDPQGTQRILKETRVKAIKRFLASNKKNTIPVAVILAFNAGVVTYSSLKEPLSECFAEDIQNGIQEKGDWGKISFEFDDEAIEANKPALIVDGQHRINGLASFEEEDVPVLIVALLDAPPAEQAFQFVVINNKSQKVPTDNVKAIISLMHDQVEELNSRLQQAGVNYGTVAATLADIDTLDESPFKGLLKWPKNAQGFIELTAIENAIRYVKTALPIIKEDDESLKEIFLAMWRAVKSKYPTLWANNVQEVIQPPKDKFMSKVNITALNEFMTEKVGNAWMDDKFDLFKTAEVEKYCSDVLLRQVPVEFWEKEWNYKLQDNSVVRTKIKEDIVRITQNLKSDKEWLEGLVLIG